MEKFKKGDKVILKSSVKNGEEYNSFEITSRIINAFFDSSFGIIVNTILGTPGNYVYNIDINGRCFNIGEDALELYQPFVHEYKVGDKVRIKKREGADWDYPCYFTDDMSQLKGNIYTIFSIEELVEKNPSQHKFYNGDKHCYYFKEDMNGYTWHSSMFEPVLEDSNPAIFTSLNEGNLISICDMTGKVQNDNIHKSPHYYLDFDGITDEQEHFTCCRKLRELVPDFEKIASRYNVVGLEFECFPEFSTIDDLAKFIQAVNNTYNSKKIITTLKKLNENEIRFQKPKASFTGGHVPTGRTICGRQHKITVVIGHLSNQAISC